MSIKKKLFYFRTSFKWRFIQFRLKRIKFRNMQILYRPKSINYWQKLTHFCIVIFHIVAIQQTRHFHLSSTLIQKVKRWRSCSWENLREFTLLVKGKYTLMSRGEIKYLSESVVVIFVCKTSLLNTLNWNKIRMLKEPMLYQDSKTRFKSNK